MNSNKVKVELISVDELPKRRIEQRSSILESTSFKGLLEQLDAVRQSGNQWYSRDGKALFIPYEFSADELVNWGVDTAEPKLKDPWMAAKRQLEIMDYRTAQRGDVIYVTGAQENELKRPVHSTRRVAQKHRERVAA